MRISLRVLALMCILVGGAGVARAHTQKTWGRQSGLSSIPGAMR